MCSMAGFRHLSEVSEDDCIYCNFKNRIFEVIIIPSAVTYDSKQNLNYYPKFKKIGSLLGIKWISGMDMALTFISEYC